MDDEKKPEDIIPPGYMVNPQGDLVKRSKIREVDLLRDEIVRELACNAAGLRELMIAFKKSTFDSISAFVDLSAERYGVKIGGKHGNITLRSYDGKYKIEVAVQNSLAFDEGLQAAKVLVDECLHRWSDGANDNLKVAVNEVFQVDQKGKISVQRVFGMLRWDIKEPQWVLAMKAVRESVTVDNSKTYLRIYQRRTNENGFTDIYDPISLDLASL